jgi:hypothetical protein
VSSRAAAGNSCETTPSKQSVNAHQMLPIESVMTNPLVKEAIGIEETANRKFCNRRKPTGKSEEGDKSVGEEIEEPTAKASGKPAAQVADQNRKLLHVFARQNRKPKTRSRVGIAITFCR